ncbi:MAG: exodeoxyribonuclease V subunit beta [Desulfobacteraceae bacterium]|jgi:exodeoxyribonuclease V beta subunit
MKTFDLLHSPLEGTNLIEASAGTGKTYTITGLFLRLALEMNLSADEILVVTFTEAATEELRDRIRGKIREAVVAFSAGRCEDAFLNQLVQTYRDPSEAVKFLREALIAFDEAAIFTIHGFCRRMLHENAFESGSLFDTELLTDEESLKREIIDDFWRKHFSSASPLFVNYAIHNKLSPESLLSLLSNRMAQPYLQIIPKVEMVDSSSDEKAFMACFREVRSAWPSVKKDIEKILTNDQGLNRSKYGKAKIPEWIRSMNDFVASGGNDPFLFRDFVKFTRQELEKAVKKGHAPPMHPFFELCEKLGEVQGKLESVFARRLLGLKVHLFQEVQDELTRKKRGKNIQTFDDLLLRLHQALAGKGGELLSKAIRRKYKAALIDEFQDTDPVQYAIFNHIFAREKSVLFFIGDPKQAIYGFRGADIFAYMEAARNVQTRYTLGENWRSEPHLIEATNTLFGHAEHPFVYDEIRFQPSGPAEDKDPEILRIDDRTGTPLQVWFLDARKWSEPGKPITKRFARDVIPKAVAAEISRLLSLSRKNRAFIGKRVLREGDIAVLVRRNAEAILVQKALSELRIPSVLYTTGNLFDSREAMETERVLAAIIEPNNEKLLKAALATDMLGVKGETLDALMEDEVEWEKRLIKFKCYHDLWHERNFVRMFRACLSQESVLTRLISLPEGERRNTNLLHLMEVLHQVSVQRNLNMTGLLKWLSEQRAPDTPRLEEHQLRLESDENAVKLVTIHKSKGLEYPVVFCPFAWDGSKMRRSKEPFTFHEDRDDTRLTLDLGSEAMDENRLSAEKEQLAENLRLLYVALTRAKCRAYLVWGRFNEAETSAPAYLLYPPPSEDRGDVVGATGEHFRALSDEAVLAGVKRISDKAGGSIMLHDMPTETGEAYSIPSEEKVLLSYRKFSGRIDRQWKISSFSSLISDHLHGEDLADRDAISPGDDQEGDGLQGSEMEEAPSGIFSFPKGTKAGTFLHDLFEHLDFTSKDSSLLKILVAGKLRQYGFEATWQDAVCDMVDRVLSVPLDGGREDFCLSGVPNAERLNEMEFYFPLKSVSSRRLRTIFEKYERSEPLSEIRERMERLEFAPVRGFMKGFMDMVFRFEGRFYLVDWKSNFLGNRVEDYDRHRMGAAMEDAFYILQYHIYTLALHQYLKLKLPGYHYEEHFGGVYYIFLRGVDPNRGSEFGIYRDRPPVDLIDELNANLIEGA